MKELGTQEKEYHRALAKQVIEAGVSRLYTVGNLMRELHEELKDAVTSKHFNDSKELQRSTKDLIDLEALILMKGSNSMGLLAVADYLIKEGEKR